jgi:hypothetical protein
MNKFIPMPDLTLLKTYLKIDPMSPSGLTWIKSYTNRIKVNTAAGSKSNYWSLKFKGITYAVHRLVYFMAHEKDPGCFDVEHKDCNKYNNNVENLRLATRQLNNANTRSAKNSSSIYKGVHWNKKLSKWSACITKDYKQIYLGLFESEEEAALAYNKQAELLYGDYALLNEVDEICKAV